MAQQPSHKAAAARTRKGPKKGRTVALSKAAPAKT